jgi:hypothetical protein
MLQQATIWNYLLRGPSLGTSIEPSIQTDRPQEDPNLFPSSHPPRAQPLRSGRKGDGCILVP